MGSAGCFRRAACASLCLMLLIGAHARAQGKTDVVVLSNGDHVTCEIKILERGRLKVSTDNMDTVYLQWNHIKSIRSAARYVVELQDGSRLQGTLAETDADGKILLQDASGERLLDMRDVVWIDPLQLNSRRLRRWDGSVSVGFDAAKANSQTSLTASFNARHRAETYLVDLDASLYSNHRADTSDSVRAKAGGLYRGLLKDRWYWSVLASGERNDELGIRLRSLAGAGGGRFIVQTGNKLWSLTGGIAATNEQRAGSEGVTNSVEAFVGTDYEYFTYDSPKTSLTIGLTAYPSLTESGRIRSNLDFNLRRELIKDLFVGLGFYYSYDSVPPDVGAKDDYGVVTSLGYSF